LQCRFTASAASGRGNSKTGLARLHHLSHRRRCSSE
jgi:hypothetical protein